MWSPSRSFQWSDSPHSLQVPSRGQEVVQEAGVPERSYPQRGQAMVAAGTASAIGCGSLMRAVRATGMRHHTASGDTLGSGAGADTV